jgi:hypothetical protein
MKRTSRLFISVATGSFCALAGLLFEIIAGTFAWTVFRGIQGLLFATVVGGFTAFLIRRSTRWPASSTAGAVGAFVAAWFTIACMEVFEPGSLEWATKGGLYGAAWGLPVGAVLGPLGLIRQNRKAAQPARQRLWDST